MDGLDIGRPIFRNLWFETLGYLHVANVFYQAAQIQRDQFQYNRDEQLRVTNRLLIAFKLGMRTQVATQLGQIKLPEGTRFEMVEPFFEVQIHPQYLG